MFIGASLLPPGGGAAPIVGKHTAVALLFVFDPIEPVCAVGLIDPQVEGVASGDFFSAFCAARSWSLAFRLSGCCGCRCVEGYIALHKNSVWQHLVQYTLLRNPP